MRVNAALLLMSVTLGLSLSAFAADQREVVETKKEEKPANPQDKVVIRYADETAPQDNEQQYQSGIGRIFRNPVLASGLASGSAAINRSIESLMETIFYNLLDQKLAYKISEHAQFAFASQRDLYPAASGGFVVFDRLGLGPEYAKELREIDGVSVSLGIDGKVNVFDIYYRTDGMRLAETEDLPFWRTSLNNWLGILPLLSMLLPPSFNPNEMYDPANILEAPFALPLSVRKFKRMPIGSIRSYNITGGVSLPIDFAGSVLSEGLKDELDDYDNVVTELPYSVFVEGEYRINVLRRSQNIAWVGLTTVRRLGHRISARAGQVLKVFEKLTPWWGGLPVKLIPLDAEASNSKAKTFNQLYEFDLRNKRAREVYVETVKGDFNLAHKAYLQQKKKKAKTGVKFHFNRQVDAIESGQNIAPNLAIVGAARDDRRMKAEIETLDERGKFWVLEAEQETEDETADALTGKEQQRISNSVEMKVLKRKNKKGDKKFEYVFSKKDKDPYNITLSMFLNDRYVNSHEYREYLNTVRYFTKLPLRDTPKIPRRDPGRLSLRRRRAVFGDPSQAHKLLHVTPTHIGRMSATAAVVFSSEVLDGILRTSASRKWRAFAEAYGLSQREWGRKNLRQTFSKKIYWLGPFVSFPFKLLSLRLAELDFIAEATSAIDALEDIKSRKKPLNKLDAFYDLLNSSHPEKLVRALLNLADLKRVPRSVTFYTKPKGRAPAEVKQAFSSLNNKVFRSVLALPDPPRSRIAENKLNAFNTPDDFSARRDRPSIVRVDLDMKTLPDWYKLKARKRFAFLRRNDRKALQRKYVYLRLFVKNMHAKNKGKIYLRLEQSGKLQVGKFVLGEKVYSYFPRSPSKGEKGLPKNVRVFHVFLNGPLSPINGVFLDSAMDFGGEFLATVASSRDGRLWSADRSFKFDYEDEKLYPPQ